MTLLYAYLGLIISAFTSATLLPGTSEAAFTAFVYRYPEELWTALLCVGIANGLGSMVSYFMGRLLPDKKRPSAKTLLYFQRYGIWLLLLAWLPIVGDALPLAAGWLRLDWKKCAVILIVGKLLRYAVIGFGVSFLSN
ncbi:YqaA family protein [Neisseria animalis]|uniref:DedA family protein n=1 Tax=Neisseria animalis TaxID=492 RepID=A0A5P3MTJ4_NEIAN|nr:YqaA family protein [Neisseria animalis]QEY24848.1 DedA family protein [Neisseria animalis]ROW31553.1 DedA family protein [Neisseria animalis]VEE07995.1 membrane protein [Neisseria animalis]